MEDKRYAKIQSIGSVLDNLDEYDAMYPRKSGVRFVRFEFAKAGLQSAELAAGPYMDRPDEFPGVKLAQEIGAPCAIDLPIPDFSVPDRSQAERAAFAAIVLMWQGATPYVGCMGGKGRTGVLLGIIAKVALRTSRPFMRISYPDPVEWVREHYRPEAIETREQEEFVREFPTKWLESMVTNL